MMVVLETKNNVSCDVFYTAFLVVLEIMFFYFYDLDLQPIFSDLCLVLASHYGHGRERSVGRALPCLPHSLWQGKDCRDVCWSREVVTWRSLFCFVLLMFFFLKYKSISCSQIELWREHGSQKDTQVKIEAFWREKATSQCPSGSKKSCLHCRVASWSSWWRCTRYFSLL